MLCELTLFATDGPVLPLSSVGLVLKLNTLAKKELTDDCSCSGLKGVNSVNSVVVWRFVMIKN